MALSARRIGLATLICAALSISTLNPALAEDDRSKPKPTAKLEFKNAKEKFNFEKKVESAEVRCR